MITTKWFEDVSSRSQPNPHCDDVSQRHIDIISNHLGSSSQKVRNSMEFLWKSAVFGCFSPGGGIHVLRDSNGNEVGTGTCCSGLTNKAWKTRRHGDTATASPGVRKSWVFLGRKKESLGKYQKDILILYLAVDCRLTYIHMYIYTVCVCVCVYWCVLVIMIRIIVQGLGPPCLTNQYISFVHGKHLPEMDGNSTWLGCKEPTRIAVIYCDIKHVGRP